MRFCFITCSIAIMFVIATIWINLSIGDKNTDFLAKLSEKQQKIYKKIIKERSQISLNGYALGLVFSIVGILINYKLRKKYSTISLACLTGAIVCTTQYFYYIFAKKSDYMILHLDNIEEKAAWLEIYKSCQYNYHFGLIIGIISAILLGSSIKCN